MRQPVTINESYISSPADGKIVNMGYYGTDIYLSETGRIVTSENKNTSEVTITAGTKPSADSESSDTNSDSSASSDDNYSSNSNVITSSDHANVYRSVIKRLFCSCI
ncbi:MAG: hypothetical protein K6A23_07335 [Butyrivibrio sp.]|nr:hypothetical protein [Butyrivibrio sp.]